MAKPEINATGSWELQSPFSVDPGDLYTCEAINGFEALEEQGIDVYIRYYAPLGLSEEVFKSDKLNKEDIVTLMGDNLDAVFVPTSYIISFPDAHTVDYSQFFMAIKLGPLPSNELLDGLSQELADKVRTVIGVSPDLKIVVHPVAGTVTLEEHEKLIAARNEMRRIDPSSESIIIELRQIAAKQAEKIGLLEEEIDRLNGI